MTLDQHRKCLFGSAGDVLAHQRHIVIHHSLNTWTPTQKSNSIFRRQWVSAAPPTMPPAFWHFRTPNQRGSGARPPPPTLRPRLNLVPSFLCCSTPFFKFAIPLSRLRLGDRALGNFKPGSESPNGIPSSSPALRGTRATPVNAPTHHNSEGVASAANLHFSGRPCANPRGHRHPPTVPGSTWFLRSFVVLLVFQI